MGAHNEIHTTRKELRGRKRAKEAITKQRVPRHPSIDLEEVVEGTFGMPVMPNENDSPTVGEMYAQECCD